MKLPTLKKILREDLKGAPEWVQPILDTVNPFMELVYQAFNKNLTLTQNLQCSVKELTYKTPSTYPSGVSDMKFVSDLKVKATGLVLLQVYDQATYAPPPGPVYIPWVENNGSIVISPITGLEADKTYLIRLWLT